MARSLVDRPGAGVDEKEHGNGLRHGHRPCLCIGMLVGDRGLRDGDLHQIR